jgi:hypothetical protein
MLLHAECILDSRVSLLWRLRPAQHCASRVGAVLGRRDSLVPRHRIPAAAAWQRSRCDAMREAACCCWLPQQHKYRRSTRCGATPTRLLQGAARCGLRGSQRRARRSFLRRVVHLTSQPKQSPQSAPGLSQCQSGCSMQRCVERCVQRSRRVCCALCAPARLPPAARRGAGASAHAAAVGPGARVEHGLASQHVQRITCCCQLHPTLCGAEMRQRVPRQVRVTRRTVSDAAPHLGIAAAR